MIHVKEAVIVEGKYDKIKLSSVMDALILETRGFRIFKDKEQMALLRRLAETRGLIVMTDSDSAGFLIRNYLTGSIDPQKIKHVYIPDIFGKEKRKRTSSKEGKLGVEGVPVEIIVDALHRAGIDCGEDPSEREQQGRAITKADLVELGLSGGQDSSAKRKELLKFFRLPEHLSVNSMIKVLNGLTDYEELKKIVEKFSNKG